MTASVATAGTSRAAHSSQARRVSAGLDAGQPEPGQAAERIGQVIQGAIQAAKPTEPGE